MMLQHFSHKRKAVGSDTCRFSVAFVSLIVRYDAAKIPLKVSSDIDKDQYFNYQREKGAEIFFLNLHNQT